MTKPARRRNDTPPHIKARNIAQLLDQMANQARDLITFIHMEPDPDSYVIQACGVKGLGGVVTTDFVVDVDAPKIVALFLVPPGMSKAAARTAARQFRKLRPQVIFKVVPRDDARMKAIRATAKSIRLSDLTLKDNLSPWEAITPGWND